MTQIKFRDIEPLDHLKDFVDEQLEHSIGALTRHKPLKANIIVEREKVKSRSQTHPEFSCEIVLHHPTFKKSLVVKKRSPNFYTSVRESCHLVERLLTRMMRRKLSKRRKSREHELANHFGDGFIMPGVNLDYDAEGGSL